MASPQPLPILAALCLTLAALLASATAAKPAASTSFVIEGRVYCDNCRAGFETTVTDYLAGAKVRLECRNSTTHEVLHEVEGATDASGKYRVEVVHDHGEEICEVVLVSSPDAGCADVDPGRDRARVLITGNNGIPSDVRYANSLGFLKKEPLEICPMLMSMYKLDDDQ